MIKKFLLFCFVGASSALIDLIAFNIAFWLGTSFITSRLVAMGIAIMYNFSMNRNFTFKARHTSVKRQVPKYAVTYITAILVNLIVSVTILNILGETTINANIASFFGIVVSIPISFFGSLLWVFKNKLKS